MPEDIETIRGLFPDHPYTRIDSNATRAVEKDGGTSFKESVDSLMEGYRGPWIGWLLLITSNPIVSRPSSISEDKKKWFARGLKRPRGTVTANQRTVGPRNQSTLQITVSRRRFHPRRGFHRRHRRHLDGLQYRHCHGQLTSQWVTTSARTSRKVRRCRHLYLLCRLDHRYRGRISRDRLGRRFRRHQGCRRCRRGSTPSSSPSLSWLR